jgi:hypothetical protein
MNLIKKNLRSWTTLGNMYIVLSVSTVHRKYFDQNMWHKNISYIYNCLNECTGWFSDHMLKLF